MFVACYFREIVDANADGGELIGTGWTLQQCTSACFAQYPVCVAVDYDVAEQMCFLQTSLSGRQWNDCCNRYEISCSCTRR